MPPPFRSGHNDGTQFETDEELRQVLRAAGGKPRPPVRPVTAASGWNQTLPPAPAAEYRPTLRPPVAVLTVLDDGGPDGEAVRIRTDRFVIGRTEGDFLLPHDPLVSTRHLEITRQQVSGRWRWVLKDLQSTNGLFVRVSRTALGGRAELLVGGGRYRFDATSGGLAGTLDVTPGDPLLTGSTQGWGDRPLPDRPPTVTELIPGGIGNRVVLVRPEYWIGTDPGCGICRPDDPFCEPRHARLFRGPGGGWFAEHPKTANGLWYRVPQAVADKPVQFQIGEQRFRFRV